MAQEPIEQVKERLPLHEVVKQYVKLERSGHGFKGRCPFHNEKSASFHVSPERNMYYCFGCHRGGDLFTFIQEIEGLDFFGALTMLAERAGVTLEKQNPKARNAKNRLIELMDMAATFYHAKLLKDADVKRYIKSRGVAEQTARSFRIGYAPNAWSEFSDAARRRGYRDQDLIDAGLALPKKSGQGVVDRFRNRIMFPLADAQGRVVAFTGRIFEPRVEAGAPETGKYVNSPETKLYHKSALLFGYDRAKRSLMEHDRCLVVEGQMDLIMSHQAGVTNAVALSGTALTDEQLNLIARFTDTVVLALDADAAGIKAARTSALKALAQEMHVEVVTLKEGEDPADMVARDPNEWIERSQKTVDYITFRLQGVSGERNMKKLLHEDLYHVVRAYVSPIARDRALGKVAHALGVTLESAREDYQSWTKSNNNEVYASPTPPAPKIERPSRGASNKLVHALTLIEWISKQNIDIDTAPFLDTIKASVTGDHMAYARDVITSTPSYLFEADMLYAGQTPIELTQALEDLAQGAHIEALEGKRRELQKALNDAEAQGNDAAVAGYLSDIQAVTSEIAQVSLRRYQ